MPQAFISWSGQQARGKARALRSLFEDVLPEAKVFMSDEDIEAGSLWLTSIAGSLDDSVAGVIVVTPENVRNPWVHYEAGALATRVERRMVIPLLSGLTPEELASTPLSVFQAVELTEEAVLTVCLSLLRALKIERKEEAIRRAFDKWWGDYEEVLLAEHTEGAKPSVRMDDLYKLMASLQAQQRAQTELLNALVRSTGYQGLNLHTTSQRREGLPVGGSYDLLHTYLAGVQSNWENATGNVGLRTPKSVAELLAIDHPQSDIDPSKPTKKAAKRSGS